MLYIYTVVESLYACKVNECLSVNCQLVCCTYTTTDIQHSTVDVSITSVLLVFTAQTYHSQQSDRMQLTTATVQPQN